MQICNSLWKLGPVGWFVLFLLAPVLLPLDAFLTIVEDINGSNS